MEAVGRVFEEVRFQPGENIITAGEPMTHVFLIAQVSLSFLWIVYTIRNKPKP
jgi:hypothetical protein